MSFYYSPGSSTVLTCCLPLAFTQHLRALTHFLAVPLPTRKGQSLLLDCRRDRIEGLTQDFKIFFKSCVDFKFEKLTCVYVYNTKLDSIRLGTYCATSPVLSPLHVLHYLILTATLCCYYLCPCLFPFYRRGTEKLSDLPGRYTPNQRYNQDCTQAVRIPSPYS